MPVTNEQIITYLGLPADTITKLQTAQGSEFSAVANQFIESLVNKICYQMVEKMDFTNPFKKYDSYPVNYGDTIENVFTDLPKGYTFNKDATDPFTKVVSDVKTLYATINYEMQYEQTIHDTLLRRATLNEYGFMNLINSLLSTLNTSRDVDEYFATIAMLNNANIYANGFEDIEVSATITDEEKADLLTHKIVDVVTDFALPKKTNNKLQVKNITPKNRNLLVIKQKLLNMINLDYLTGVFNLSKVDLLSNIIAVDSFKVENESGVLVGEDLDFVILDEKGFDNHVALQDSGMIYNPKGKYTNHFVNLWKIISYKYYYNARAFKFKGV